MLLSSNYHQLSEKTFCLNTLSVQINLIIDIFIKTSLISAVKQQITDDRCQRQHGRVFPAERYLK